MTGTTPARRVSLYPILSINFVGTLGFSIVLPFLVFLVTRFGGNGLIYGVMGATYSLFQLIGAPILGRWSDRYGRRRILLLSQLGTLASWAIFLGALFLPATTLTRVDSPVLGAFAVTLPLMVLFVARALDGLTGGNVSVANAYLADVTPERDRAAAFGKMAISGNLGFIVGPALAGVLGATAWGETLPVVAALLISLVAALLIILLLPEVPACTLVASPEHLSVRKVMGQEQRDCYELETAGRLSAREILAQPSVPGLMVIYFLIYLAFNVFYIAFPVHAATRLEWTLTDTGIFFAFMGLLMVLVQGPVLARASARWSDRTLVIGGSLLLGTSFLCYTAESRVAIYVGTAVLALGNGLMWPSLLAIISKVTGPAVQGAIQGFAGSAAAVASIVGLLVGGLLYGVLESRVFVLSAAITLAVFVAALALVPAPAATREVPQT